MAMSTDRIEKKVLLRAPRARVWRALTDAEEFGSWFGMKVDGAFVQGQSVQGRIVPSTVDPESATRQKRYEGLVFELRIERVEPESLFSFRWHPAAVERGVDYSAEPTTLVSFELKEVQGGVLLTVTESGFDGLPLARRAKAFESNEQGWAKQMERIENYLVQKG
jgi:uncharacterized protein YndB with AHSA1/START domain